MELASVWPLTEGLKGVDRFSGDTIILNTFQKGFMELEQAKKLDAAGELQMMVGLDMQSLKHRGDNSLLKKVPNKTPVKKKSTYKTKVVTPQD